MHIMKRIYLNLLISIIGFSAFAQNNQVRQFKFDASVSPDNYYSDKVVFKLKEALAPSASARFITDDKFQALSKELGGVDLKQFFDVSTIPTSNLRKRDSVKSDLSLIYEMTITKSLEYSINKLLKSGLVEYAEPKFISRPLYNPNDPDSDSLTGKQYHLKLIKAYEAWNDVANRGDASAVLGIVDTGFELTNPDMAGNIAAGGIDLGDNDNDPTYGASDHGVAVSSLSSAITDNGVGLAGTGFNSKFLPIKAAATGSSNIVAGFEGIDYAITKGCKVINCSWGHYGYSQAEQDKMNDIVANNDVLIIAAAGNSGGKNDKIYPAAYENVLSVTHTDWQDLKQSGDFNNAIDIAAPGVGVYGYMLTSGGKTRTGSSLASPIVAGAATALRVKYPSYTAMQIAEVLRMSADIIDTLPGNATYKGLIGRGRLNMFEAFKGMQTPSIRVVGYNILNKNNDPAVAGDTANFTNLFKNFLLPTTSNTTVKLKINDPYIKLIDSVITIGAIGTLVTKDNNANPFKFVVASNTPIDYKFSVKLIFEDDLYSDYMSFDVSLNSSVNIDMDINKAVMTISTKGRNGYSDLTPTGTGWVYKNRAYLYESGLMVATSSTKVSDAVRTPTVLNDHFAPLENTFVVNNPTYGKLITTKFDDSKNPNKIGVEISQKSFAWNTTNLDKTIVVEYKIKNTSGAKFDSLCVGLFTDVDVDGEHYNEAASKWDATHHVGYAYNVNTNALGFAGFKLLTPQKENFYAMDNSDGIQGNVNPNSEFTAANKFKVLSSGIARTVAGGVNGNDISAVIGATVYNLEPNATTTVAFAYIMADTEAEMLTNADAIQAKYIAIRKGVKPVITDKVVCLNQKATLNPTGGTAYEFYKASTIANQNLLSVGSSYLTNNIAADTAFYIVNKDSIFDSDVAKVKVNVSKLNPDFSYTLDNSPGRVLFESANNVSDWSWNFGDNSTGNGQLTNNTYLSANTYDVKMVITNNIGCKDSITKQVEVSNFVTSSTYSKLQKGEVFNVYPNPSNGNINLNIHLNSTETIAVKVSDVIGNVVFESNGIPESLDLSNQKSGLYILQVKTGERVITQKIEITK